ncbi:MAG: 4-hydroxy-tetrahydrodipicolinate reductase [Leptospirales bacterium]
MNTPVRIAVVGAAGRMGVAIQNVLARTPGAILGAAITESGDPSLGKPLPYGKGVYQAGLEKVSGGADVGIDFSVVPSTLETVRIFASAGLPLVIGTTGFSKDERDEVLSHSTKIPVLLSPNMSLGVHLLAHLVSTAASVLSDYDGEVVEIHHRMKKDAPSGTALYLAEAMARARGVALSEVGTFQREGMTGPRSPGSIGVMSVRGGDVVGDHTVYFLGEGERVELTHRATSRETFARGAVAAALFLSGKPPGVYTMNDVLGLSVQGDVS